MKDMMREFGDANFEKVLEPTTGRYPSEASARLANALFNYLARELYRYDGIPRDERKVKFRNVSLTEAVDEAVGLVNEPEVGGLLGRMREIDGGIAMVHLVKIRERFGDMALGMAVETAQKYHPSLSRYVLENFANSNDLMAVMKIAEAMNSPKAVEQLNARPDDWLGVFAVGEGFSNR